MLSSCWCITLLAPLFGWGARIGCGRRGATKRCSAASSMTVPIIFLKLFSDCFSLKRPLTRVRFGRSSCSSRRRRAKAVSPAPTGAFSLFLFSLFSLSLPLLLRSSSPLPHVFMHPCTIISSRMGRQLAAQILRTLSRVPSWFSSVCFLSLSVCPLRFAFCWAPHPICDAHDGISSVCAHVLRYIS